jgi:hypothetical protein
MFGTPLDAMLWYERYYKRGLNRERPPRTKTVSTIRGLFFLSVYHTMERRTLYLWLIGISFVGILCIFTLGRPTSDIPTVPVAAGYTPAPSPGPTVSPTIVAQIASSAATPPALTTVTPVVDPRSQGAAVAPPPADAASASALTMAAGPAFSAASVLNMPLRESIGKIAQNVPGANIRPYPLGATVPPGPAVANRWNIAYDPSTLVVAQVTQG